MPEPDQLLRCQKLVSNAEMIFVYPVPGNLIVPIRDEIRILSCKVVCNSKLLNVFLNCKRKMSSLLISWGGWLKRDQNSLFNREEGVGEMKSTAFQAVSTLAT